MPRYELMYILASSVSDDQVPTVASQILKFVSDFGGTDVTETQLGKKKLAYPIKKTRNGFYGLIDFSMPTTKINEFDAKIRTQDSTIIRYIIVNMDEHLARTDKDAIVQAKMNRILPPGESEDNAPMLEKAAPAPKREKPVAPAPVVELNAEELDKKIEEALSEDILK